MGNLASTFCGRSKGTILIVGLDAAGKTTMLYKMKLGEVITTIPSIGLTVETLTRGSWTITMFDVGGRDKARALRRHYYRHAEAVVFLVDSADPDRMEQASDEFHETLADEEMVSKPALLLCNKQDLPGALPAEEIGRLFKIEETKSTVLTMPCSAQSGDGLYEAFDALLEKMKDGKAEKTSSWWSRLDQHGKSWLKYYLL